MENENSVQIEDTAVKATKKPLSRLAKIIITVIVAIVGVGGILAGILFRLRSEPANSPTKRA